MTIRSIGVLVAALCLSALLLPPSPAGAARPTPASVGGPAAFGMSFGGTLARMAPSRLDAALDDARGLGVRWIRIDLPWTDIQPTGPDDWRWAPFDRVVRAARKRHLRVLPILTYTPAWARDAGCARFTCPPRGSAFFARFARAAVKRYAKRSVHTWEVWNEPNFAGFWSGPDPARYGALLTRTTRAIRRADHSARVLLGGLSGAEPTWSKGSIGPREFLAAVCRTGACRRIGGVAYHPYTYPYLASDRTLWGTAWEKISWTTYSLRSVLREAGHPRMPIWLTEDGAPTGGGAITSGALLDLLSTADHVTEARQAQIASDAVRTAAGMPEVAALFWYTDQDDPSASGKEAHFGLRRADGSAKPAWEAFRSAVAATR